MTCKVLKLKLFYLSMSMNLKPEYKKIFKLSWPIFLESLLRLMLGNIDIIMLNRFDEKAVAAVGMTYTLIGFLIMLFQIVGSGISILITQNLGAGKNEDAEKAASNSLLVSFLFGVVVSFLTVVTIKPVLNVMELDVQVAEYAHQYFMVYGSFCFVVSLGMSLSSILRSYGHTKVPMFISLITNVINVGGNYIAIFGFWVIPSTGVAGVAMATIISQFIGAVIMFVIAEKYSIKITLKRIFNIDFKVLKQVFQLGGSIAGLRIFFSICLTIITMMISRLGYQSMNAHVYVRLFIRYVLLFGSTISQSLLITVGNMVGAGEFNKAYKLTNNILKLAFVIALLLLLGIYFNIDFLMRLFTEDSVTLAYSVNLALIAIFFESFRTLNITILGSLRGSGDVHFIIFTGIPRLCAVILGYILAFHYDYGVVGIWIAMALDEFARSVIIFLRWHSRKWEEKALVKAEKKVTASAGS